MTDTCDFFTSLTRLTRPTRLKRPTRLTRSTRLTRITSPPAFTLVNCATSLELMLQNFMPAICSLDHLHKIVALKAFVTFEETKMSSVLAVVLFLVPSLIYSQILDSTLQFLPCDNITFALDPTGFTGISRISCGLLCLISENCNAFTYNTTTCFIEDDSIVNETRVLAEDGCYATKGK